MLVQDFGGKPYHAPYAVSSNATTPTARDGVMSLLHEATSAKAAIGFSRTAKGSFSNVAAQWTMRLDGNGRGLAFVLLPTATDGSEGAPPADADWDEANLAGAFAVCFDTHNPPSEDPFNADGNIYGRPEREVSLHWDGREIANRLSGAEFRGAECLVRVDVAHVVGGAEVSVRVGGAAVYDRFFLPEMHPFEHRVAFGAVAGDKATSASVDDVVVRWSNPSKPTDPPLSVIAIDKWLNNADHHKIEREVEFPADNYPYGRILCTLTLDKPEAGYDPWDRSAAIYVYDETGERFEVLRYITPYRRGHRWTVDVSDFRPLLRGRKRVAVECGTYGQGWLVSVEFRFHKGPAERYAYAVKNLWTGSPEYGNPEKPMDDFFVPQRLKVDQAAIGGKLRFTVTGHGMSPNSENAAEFMRRGRTVTVGGKQFYNVLWKEDNYLNPCRPQGGTWKYDRAGWAPGDVVTPWEIDISALIRPGEELTIEYEPDPYVNQNRGQTWAPFHWVESQLVLYR